MDLAIVVAVVAVALVFAYTNGFHDASNAIATSVTTRALTPRVALALATAMNFLGAFLGQDVARAVQEVITPEDGSHGLVVVLSGIVGAIVWNLLTWWRGLPSSSSHAVIGGLVGAAVVSGTAVTWLVVVTKVLVPMIVSPLVGFALAFVLMAVLVRVLRHGDARRVHRGFRMAQTVSAAAVALAHGLQDAQKTMGVVVLALVAGGYLADDDGLPTWVVLVSAAALSLGTAAGGWRITRTLGSRLVRLDPARGFAAESVSAGVLYTTALVFHAPVSTTHTITSAVVGAGATRGAAAVRWDVGRRILLAWLLTPLAGALLAVVTYGVCRLVLQLP